MGNKSQSSSTETVWEKEYMPLSLEVFIRENALAKSTRMSYEKAWSFWVDYVLEGRNVKKSNLEGTDTYLTGVNESRQSIIMSQFIEHARVKLMMTHDRLGAVIAAITYMFEINNRSSLFIKSSLVKRAMDASGHIRDPPSSRVALSGSCKAQPITLEMLEKKRPKPSYWVYENLMEISRYLGAMLAFHLLMRSSEYTSETIHDKRGLHTILLEHLEVDTADRKINGALWKNDPMPAEGVTGIFIKIPSSKTDQRASGSTHNLSRTKDGEMVERLVVDLLWWIENANPIKGSMLLRSHTSDEEDVNPVGRSLTRRAMSDYAKAVAKENDRDPNLYSSHSFRVGGAEFMASKGSSHEEINRAGRWSRNSVSSIGYREPTSWAVGGLSLGPEKGEEGKFKGVSKLEKK